MTYQECYENINYEEYNYQNNNLRNNNSNEEGEHSTSGSSKTQISSSKSNNSTPEVCKIFNKNDNTPVENDDMFKITPHFINEKPINKNIQFIFNNNNNNTTKEKKTKYARPLTPNLNILRKSSAPINQSNTNKLISKINNDNGYLIQECKKYISNNNIDKNIYEKIYDDSEEKDSNEKKENNINSNMNIDKRFSQGAIKTDSNIKKHYFSCTKNKILKNNNNFLYTNSSINENYITQNNYNNYNNNKKQPLKNTANNSINNSNSNNKIPFSFNTNRNMQLKNKNNNSNLNGIHKEKAQKKNLSMISRRNSNKKMNKSIIKKKHIRNISRKNKEEVILSEGLKAFKSENKITVVHSKVNDEINNLFNGLSDNIVKDPEIHNKIECLIKDIKDIQQVVHRKTQTHFRPRKQNSINFRKKDGDNCN